VVVVGSFAVAGIIAEFQHFDPQSRVVLQLETAVQTIELPWSHRAELAFVAAPEIEKRPLSHYQVVIDGKPRSCRADHLATVSKK
jgi:hypothetical protein